MNKMKIIEIVITAGIALFSAAKDVIKFIDCIIKLKSKKAIVSTE